MRRPLRLTGSAGFLGPSNATDFATGCSQTDYCRITCRSADQPAASTSVLPEPSGSSCPPGSRSPAASAAPASRCAAWSAAPCRAPRIAAADDHSVQGRFLKLQVLPLDLADDAHHASIAGNQILGQWVYAVASLRGEDRPGGAEQLLAPLVDRRPGRGRTLALDHLARLGGRLSDCRSGNAAAALRHLPAWPRRTELARSRPRQGAWFLVRIG